MAGLKHEVPDAPVCPALGLALDPRTRYTFPHSAHRCYAARSPRGIEPGRQSTYCLNRNFTACDRYQVWQRREVVAQQPESRRLDEGSSSARAGNATTTSAPGTQVIYVSRVDDSVRRGQ